MANRGEALEKYILSRCHADGYRLLSKTDPPVRIIRWLPGNQFKGAYLEDGKLDLTGSASGYHVEIEVKDCQGMRWPLSKLRKHQLQQMKDLQRDTALSGLALRLRGVHADDDYVYLIPARRVIDFIEAEKKSITLKDLQLLEEQGLVVHHIYSQQGSIKAFFKLVIDTFTED